MKRTIRGVRCAVLLCAGVFSAGPRIARAEDAPAEPVWWLGASGAVNLNYYGGTTQQLNDGLVTPAPFHKGLGAGPYLALSLAYTPDPVWGGFLNLAFDDRRGTFDPVTCPCGEQATLSATPAYLSLEPGLRVAPFGGNLHLFAGPRIGFLASPSGTEREFHYAQEGVTDVTQRFGAMRRWVFSAQAGLGYDLDWAPGEVRSRIRFTPFVSWQPHFGQDPRDTDPDVERWAITTVRVGVSVFWGRGTPASPAAPDVGFSARAPAAVVEARAIRETFPLRNYVFFEEGSASIPARYPALAGARAAAFREEGLQEEMPAAPTGRSRRQLAVYRNLLNILGDRLRRHPEARVLLTGMSVRGREVALARAEAVRRYLVDAHGVEAARVAVAWKEPPPPPLGRTEMDLRMLREENERVEVSSESPELLVQVGEDGQFMLKPVEINGSAPGTDSVVLLVPGARKLASWSVEVTGEDGQPMLFGPFFRERETLPATPLLGGRARAAYAAVMTGAARNGATVRRQAAFVLTRRADGILETGRFAILFDIDKARAVSAYEKFLSDVVATRITDTTTVFIRGRTDVVGDAGYNRTLSRDRAEGVKRRLEGEGWRAGRKRVSYRTTWSGENPGQAPFGNTLPEERFYNRTVIIDIVPD